MPAFMEKALRGKYFEAIFFRFFRLAEAAPTFYSTLILRTSITFFHLADSASRNFLKSS